MNLTANELRSMRASPFRTESRSKSSRKISNPSLEEAFFRSTQFYSHAVYLMEEFRSPVVDGLVMWLVNRSVLRPTDFTWPNKEGGVYLNEDARRVFLKHFEDRITELVSYPGLEGKVSYRRAIQLQVQRYKRYLVGKEGYEPFVKLV